MAELPSGTVTFLFTDLEGSTRLWEEHREAMQSALARHDAVLRAAVESHGGHVVKTTGDGLHAVFATAPDATAAALDAQQQLLGEVWPLPEPLRVRMGLHTGHAEMRDGDYYGPAVNRAARVAAAAHGGQIVMSHATEELVRDEMPMQCDLVDLGEHRLRDLSRPERVFQVAAAGLPAEFAPLRTLDAFPTNLPLQMTSFVGRGRELVEITQAFDDSRLVTLTGVGGVGKTRLAVQVGAELLPRFGDGVWLCELGPVADRGLVPEVVAAALGVQQRPGMSPAESILAACRKRELVLVLDNCEHLLDAAARLVEAMVRACPEVCVLATSREGLGMSGERILVVRSLGLPASDGLPGEPMEEAAAVRLFCDRAASARDGFVLGADNRDAVAQICSRLDGIPLAIELAAARMRMMTPGEIAGRLDERFRLLTGGARTAVERHQTLRQAVDWSYDLLAPRERELLNRLGVFAGGFTLDAAESVAAGGGIEVFEVLDSLGQLVDKSLVVADPTPAGTRYRLLETIRQYALERLDDAGETDTTRRRHATWCAGFIAEASLGMQGPDEAAWWERLDRETDNVRAALTWATGADDAELSFSLIGNFGMWTLNSRPLGYVLGPWAAAALATTGAADDPRFASVLAIRAIDHVHHQRLDEAERDARRAIDLMAEPNISFSANPWSVLCFALMTSGRADEIEGVDAYVDAARATGDDYTLAAALAFVASQWYVLGNQERCLPFAEEAMQVAQRIGNPTLMALAGTYLGAALEATDPPRARTTLETAIEHATTVGSGSHLSAALTFLARMSTDAAGPKWATRFRSVLDIAYEAGDTHYVVLYLDMYTQALANTHRAEPAAMLRAAVAELAPHMSNPISVAHRHEINERLLTQLGEERFAELTAHGATLGYEEAVALAFAELDRVIANDNNSA
jgi:predicted ATPase/class 3 adenylate cyclase